jgi:Flp pilus assembly protein TadD
MMFAPPQGDALFKTLKGAEEAFLRQNWQKAVKLYSQAIEDPRFPQIPKEKQAASYLNRGFCRRKIGEQRAALQDYQLSANLNPRSFKPHLNAALILAQDWGDYGEALVEFDKAYELNPTNVEILSSRGLTKQLMGDPTGAEADLQAAIGLDPNHPDPLCNLGNVYLQRGDLEKAAVTYQKALNINPRDSEIRANLALAMSQMGSTQSAMDILRQDKKALKLWASKGLPVPPRIWATIGRFVIFVAILLGLLWGFTILLHGR